MNNNNKNNISKRSCLSKEEMQEKIKIAMQNYKSIGFNTCDNIKNQFNIKENSLVEKAHTASNDFLKKNNFQVRNSIVRSNLDKDTINFEKLLININEFINGDKNVYLTFGGVGDLLLLIAVCHDNEKAHVIFMANEESNKFARKFLDFFNLKYIICKNLMGTKQCSTLYKKITNHPNFTLSAHLADRCDYGDWIKNSAKYKNRLVLGTNWSDLIGIKNRERKYIVICPSGSHKSESRQRYLNIQEYQTIVKIYLEKGYEVITASCKNDFKKFGLYPDENCYWLTDSELINHRGLSQEIDFNTFLQIIISCDEVVSTDTWIKTFMLLCGKSAHVIKTRYNSKYQDVGKECCDHIFLNKDFWPKLKIYTYEDFIEYIKMLPIEL
jgi:hypothetical protein